MPNNMRRKPSWATQVLENGVALGPALRVASLADGQSLKTVSDQTLKVIVHPLPVAGKVLVWKLISNASSTSQCIVSQRVRARGCANALSRTAICLL